MEENKKGITTRQRKALHLFFSNICDHLNERGLDQRAVLEPGIAIPWTPQAFKDQIWRKIQLSMFDIKSTNDIDSVKINKILDVIYKNFGENWDIYEEFPSIESMVKKIYHDDY